MDNNYVLESLISANHTLYCTTSTTLLPLHSLYCTTSTTLPQQHYFSCTPSTALPTSTMPYNTISVALPSILPSFVVVQYITIYPLHVSYRTMVHLMQFIPSLNCEINSSYYQYHHYTQFLRSYGDSVIVFAFILPFTIHHHHYFYSNIQYVP